jgi:hypothetical protein
MWRLARAQFEASAGFGRRRSRKSKAVTSMRHRSFCHHNFPQELIRHHEKIFETALR